MFDGGSRMRLFPCSWLLAPRYQKRHHEDAECAKEQPVSDGGCLMEAGVAELPPFNLPVQESMK